MKFSACFSATKKSLAVVGLMIVLVIGLFLFPGCQNNPSPPEANTSLGEVYVANMGAHSIMGYERHNDGSLDDTVRIIRGPDTDLHNPFDVSIDGLGRIWVANLGDPPATNPTITVYEPNSNGNAAPSFTFSLQVPFGGHIVPGSLVKFGAEVMFATGPVMGGVTGPNTPPGFTIIKATIVGRANNLEPAFTGSSSGTELINPTGIAFKTDSIFVATSSLALITGLYSVSPAPESAILLFGRDANGFNPTSGSMIAGNNTGLSNPAHIEFDRSGNLYVLNRGIPGSSNSLPSITIHGPVRGNVAPIRVIRGANTGLTTAGVPYGLAVDENGFIYVTAENRILVFDGTANGNVAPSHTLNNSPLSGARNADLSSPVGIAVR